MIELLSRFLNASTADFPALGRIAGGVSLALAVALILLLRAFVTGRARRREAVAAAARAAGAEAAHAQVALRLAGAEASLAARDARLAELRDEADALSDALHGARNEAARLREELAGLRTAAAKDVEAAAARIAQLTDLRAELTAEFRALSAETLRQQAGDTMRLQSDGLGALLTPLREQVDRFQTELQQRESAAGQERAALRQQIETLQARSEAISQEAVALTRALKGDKQRQGAWGEMILTRLLEESGLQSGTHFELQGSRRDADGRLLRPDVVVRMPQGRRLVVDSKVSLLAYEEAVNAETPEDRASAMRRHLAALRAHVASLAAKGYAALEGEGVDFVFMFVPLESAFIDAARADAGLWREANRKGVIITPPSNLLVYLRTVEHLWAVERRDTNAAEIARRAGLLYDKFVGFTDSMKAVGEALGRATRTHEQAFNLLRHGNGNLVRQAEILRELGARTDKRLEIEHDGDGAAP